MINREFKLKDYDGPLDLLLTLIGKAQIDIRDIFVSEITDQYLEIVRNAPDLDMDGDELAQAVLEKLRNAALFVEVEFVDMPEVFFAELMHKPRLADLPRPHQDKRFAPFAAFPSRHFVFNMTFHNYSLRLFPCLLRILYHIFDRKSTG